MESTFGVRIERHGGPDVIETGELRLAAPGPHEVRLRQSFVGLNYIDVYHRSGLYPLALPHSLGLEAAGVVTALGREVSTWQVGDRVAYAGGDPGAYVKERNVPADRLVRLPDEISDETAASVLLKGLTAEFLVRRTYAVQPGDLVLVHAAAGGVGTILCQWLKDLGARVIGTVGSAEKAEQALRAGAEWVIRYREENFVERVQAITGGQKVRVVYDSVGRDTFLGSLDCLAPRGLMVSFGNASGKPEPFDIGLLAQKGSLYLTRPTLFSYVASAGALQEAAAALFDRLRAGAIARPEPRRFPLAEARLAHQALQAREITGSAVLVVG